MPLVAKMLDEKRYVRLDFDGRVSISELEQSRTILKSTLHESNGYRKILVDMQKASLVVSIIDILRFVSSYKDELPEGGFDLEAHVKEIERGYIAQALQRAGGVQVKAAEMLGMSFRSFRYYVKKYNLR